MVTLANQEEIAVWVQVSAMLLLGGITLGKMSR